MLVFVKRKKMLFLFKVFNLYSLNVLTACIEESGSDNETAKMDISFNSLYLNFDRIMLRF